MTTYFPWENKKIEEVKKKIMDVLPPIPQPPTPEETGEAWKKVVTETPEYMLPFAPKVDVKQLGKALVGTASALTSQPGLEFLQPLQIKAYHGSPYKFSKFATEKIGTGEGAQAFGYGHYLTESPEVAQKYARDLSRIKKAEAITEKHYTGKGQPESVNEYLYETTIHKGKQPSEYMFMSYEESPAKQPDVVKKIMKQIRKEELDVPGSMKRKEYEYLETLLLKPELYTGGRKMANVYAHLRDILGSEQEASNFLQRAGISGIKYPTGSLSGMKDIGKYNYVVFNPEDITIESILPKGVEKK